MTLSNLFCTKNEAKYKGQLCQSLKIICPLHGFNFLAVQPTSWLAPSWIIIRGGVTKKKRQMHRRHLEPLIG